MARDIHLVTDTTPSFFGSTTRIPTLHILGRQAYDPQQAAQRLRDIVPAERHSQPAVLVSDTSCNYGLQDVYEHLRAHMPQLQLAGVNTAFTAPQPVPPATALNAAVADLQASLPAEGRCGAECQCAAPAAAAAAAAVPAADAEVATAAVETGSSASRFGRTNMPDPAATTEQTAFLYIGGASCASHGMDVVLYL